MFYSSPCWFPPSFWKNTSVCGLQRLCAWCWVSWCPIQGLILLYIQCSRYTVGSGSTLTVTWIKRLLKVNVWSLFVFYSVYFNGKANKFPALVLNMNVGNAEQGAHCDTAHTQWHRDEKSNISTMYDITHNISTILPNHTQAHECWWLGQDKKRWLFVL